MNLHTPQPLKLSARKFISNLVSPSTLEVRAHKLVNNTPYPSRSPYGIEQLASTVINVPKDEIDNFIDTVVKRYIKTIKKEAFTFFSRDPRYKKTSDKELEFFLSHSLFSKFLNPTLDHQDVLLFEKFTNEKDQFFKIDLAHLDTMEPLEGFYFCSTRTLLKREKDSVKLIAIQIQDLVLTPGDPDWERAKLFLISGLCTSLLIHEHPKRHFAFDAINGLVKCLIPEKHIIHRLLKPHMYMQLPLNFSVLYVDKSVALNEQNEPYSCLPNTKKGTISSLKASYSGIDGNSSYPKFKYYFQPEKIPYSFGELLDKYWRCIFEFVKEFIDKLPANDKIITDWANDVSHFVPGFPDGNEIWKYEVLARSLTTYIYNVSFAHSSDHCDYSKTNINQMPSRIRIKPPSSNYRNIPLDAHKVFTRFDLHRHHLAMEMYFKPSNLVTILETKYATFNQQESMAVFKFKDNLEEIEEQLTIANYFPLKDVACSIQY